MNPVDELLDRMLSASWEGADLLAEDAVLDATVPGWRFPLVGREAVRAQLAHWFRDPAEVVELRRTPLPTGELVELFFHWEEESGRHWANQVHVLEVVDGRIARDRMWCGGRWDQAAADEMRLAELVG